MPVSPSFRTYVMEQLGRIRSDLRDRSMFGGVGIYAGESFFALIAGDTVYFKVDDTTRPAFVAQGLGPFRPFGDGGEVMQYYEVPAELLEDPDRLRPWMEDAVQVAVRAKGKRRRKT